MIRQALHGYSQGHRLLAASGPLEPAERGVLDRYSDLPGYLPLNFRFVRYLTGYPCSQGFALACTWPDPDAPRGGAVLTHTLLLDEEAIREVSFTGLCSLFRRPSGEDRAPFTAPLPLPPGDEDPTDAPPEVLAAVFGPGPRPVCRSGTANAERIVAAVWARLWHEARRQFAFCTCALAPIALPARPFDLLFVPTEARGAFSRLAPAWADPRAEAPPWLGRMSPPEAVPRLLARCRAAGSRLPEPSQVWLLVRLEELEAPARERLGAASARADLLARLWPEANDAPACWRDALADLVRALPQAPVEPKPYWALTDLLERPQLGAVLGGLPLLPEAIRGEVERRFPLASPPGELWAAARRWGLADALVAGVKAAVTRAASRDEVARMVRRSVAARDGLLFAVLEAVPRAARVGACGDTVGDADVMAAARALRDPSLMLASGAAAGAQVLPEAMGVSSDGERVAVLRAAPPAEARAWVFEHGDALSDAEIADLEWDIEGLAAACEAPKTGTRIFDLLARASPRARRLNVLTRHPLLAERLLTERPASPVATDAAEALPPDRLPDLLEPAMVRGRVVTLLVPPLARRLLSGPPDAHLGRFLAVKPVVQALNALSRWQLGDLLRPADTRVWLPHLVLSAGAGLTDVPTLLVRALRDAEQAELEDAADGLLTLDSWPLPVAAEVLGAVWRTRARAGSRLLGRAFVPVWRGAMDGRGELSSASWWEDFWWDRAKNLRHWLVDVWVSEGWPAEDLDAILAQAPELVVKTRKRLDLTPAGRALSRRLSAVVVE